MIDVQNQADTRRIDIDKVGVKNIRYPITVLDKAKGRQRTVASVNMYVNLPHHYKGTHMSRFIEILSDYRREISPQKLPEIMEEMKRRLNAASAHMELTFPYFIEKTAPVSGRRQFDGIQLLPQGRLERSRPGHHRGSRRAHHHALPLFQGDQRGPAPTISGASSPWPSGS